MEKAKLRIAIAILTPPCPLSHTNQAESLLAHPKIFGVNVKNINEAKNLVRDVSPLGRLPKPSLEGLKLLRDCWDEFDVVLHLSNMYKMATQFAHFILLLSAVVIIIFALIESRAFVVETVVAHDSDATSSEIFDQTPHLWPDSWLDHTAEGLRHTVFGLTLWSMFAFAAITLFNPRARWHHLRIHARVLESIIWSYRTRTGVFSPDAHARDIDNEESPPEDKTLSAALATWRETVVHSGDLSMVRPPAHQKSNLRGCFEQTHDRVIRVDMRMHVQIVNITCPHAYPDDLGNRNGNMCLRRR